MKANIKKLTIMAVILVANLTTMAFADNSVNRSDVGQPDMQEIQLNKLNLDDKEIIVYGIEQLDEINQNSKFQVKTLNINGETIKAYFYTKTTEAKDIGLIIFNGILQVGFIVNFVFFVIGKTLKFDVGRYVETLVIIGFTYFIWITFF